MKWWVVLTTVALLRVPLCRIGLVSINLHQIPLGVGKNEVRSPFTVSPYSLDIPRPVRCLLITIRFSTTSCEERKKWSKTCSTSDLDRQQNFLSEPSCLGDSSRSRQHCPRCGLRQRVRKIISRLTRRSNREEKKMNPQELMPKEPTL